MRYAIIVGNPFTGYTGTLTFTGLRVYGTYRTKAEVDKALPNAYEEGAGLCIVIDNVFEVS